MNMPHSRLVKNHDSEISNLGIEMFYTLISFNGKNGGCL
jgi:hypothetical protein